MVIFLIVFINHVYIFSAQMMLTIYVGHYAPNVWNIEN